MVVKLYVSKASTCTRSVALVLHEKQVPFKFHNIDLMKEEQKDADYQQNQHFGQVPYLVRIK